MKHPKVGKSKNWEILNWKLDELHGLEMKKQKEKNWKIANRKTEMTNWKDLKLEKQKIINSEH